MKNLDSIIISDMETMTIFAEKGKRIAIHNRSTFGLSFCIRGVITYSHRGKRYLSTPERAIILPMGESYELYNNEGGEFPLINFSCTEPFTDEFLVIPLYQTEEYLNDYKKIRRLETENGSHLKKMMLLYGIFDRLVGEFKTKTPHLGRAVQYIITHLDDPMLSNAQIAANVGISEVYLRRLFVEGYKTTPRQYIIDARIQRARQLLRESKKTVTEIASCSGFSNVYHFCRAFKQSMGLTPSEYRMRYHGGGI